jgi:hypothetical protein
MNQDPLSGEVALRVLVLLLAALIVLLAFKMR